MSLTVAECKQIISKGRQQLTAAEKRIGELEALVRDIWDGDPRCIARGCGDCEHDEDDGCGIYRRMCELGLMEGDAE